MGYCSNSNGDSIADSSPRNIPDKGCNKRVRSLYQNNRQPSLSEAQKRRSQGLLQIGEETFSYGKSVMLRRSEIRAYSICYFHAGRGMQNFRSWVESGTLRFEHRNSVSLDILGVCGMPKAFIRLLPALLGNPFKVFCLFDWMEYPT